MIIDGYHDDEKETTGYKTGSHTSVGKEPAFDE